MVKRFEEDRDVVSIYFDKLTSQRTCISFIVSRETVVDRPEPANVRLYDYYQQELTVSAVSNPGGYFSTLRFPTNVQLIFRKIPSELQVRFEL